MVECSAKEAISGLTLTLANYLEAVSILQRCFGNKQMIIARHMDVLLSVESVSSSHNVVAHRCLFDKIEPHVHELKALGVTPDSYGSVLSPVLVKKLPHELRLFLSCKISDDEWELGTLVEMIINTYNINTDYSQSKVIRDNYS